MKNYSKKRFMLFLISLILSSLLIYYHKEFSKTSIHFKQRAFFETNTAYEFVKKFESKCKCNYMRNSHKQIKLYKNENFYLISIENKSYKISVSTFDNLNQTCDWFKVLKRGLNQKVISYSLYGQNEFYYRRLKNLAKQIRSLYSNNEWSMRVYYDRSINDSIICDLECNYDIVDFCFIEDIQFKFNSNVKLLNGAEIHAMKWRWFPLGDSFVDIFMSRDTDNSILMREVNAVNEWLTSNKTAHIMRDHPGHGIEILGGMWGFRNDLNRKLANHIFYDLIINKSIRVKYNSNLRNAKGSDQNFLSAHVYPLIRNEIYSHDSYFCLRYEHAVAKAFPDRRIGNCFVGNPYDCNQTETFHKCPLACRPSQHNDWEYC